MAPTNRKPQSNGFSLVELMVVIAIIGALAAIAIPKYDVFIAKSRMSEAKSNLVGIYSFNKNFLTQYNGYTSSLGAMGFQAEGKLRYSTGFTTSSCPPNYFSANPTAVCDPTSTTVVMCGAGASCSTLQGADGQIPPTELDYSSISATFDGFVASASANLVSGNANDIWTIDQDKNLVQAVDGTNPDAVALTPIKNPIIIAPHGPVQILD